MNKEQLEQAHYDYVDNITNFMMMIKNDTARGVCVDLWKHYPDESRLLIKAIVDTKPGPALLREKDGC